MKLELKHLAPYLPYGIQIEYKEANGNYFSEDLFHIETKRLPSEKTCIYVNKMLHLSNVKPKLRHTSEISYSVVDKIIKKGVELGILNDNDISMLRYFLKTWDTYYKAPLFAIEILCENHYDVFGLIDAGLAIDINSLTPIQATK